MERKGIFDEVRKVSCDVVAWKEALFRLGAGKIFPTPLTLNAN